MPLRRRDLALPCRLEQRAAAYFVESAPYPVTPLAREVARFILARWGDLQEIDPVAALLGREFAAGLLRWPEGFRREWCSAHALVTWIAGELLVPRVWSNAETYWVNGVCFVRSSSEPPG